MTRKPCESSVPMFYDCDSGLVVRAFDWVDDDQLLDFAEQESGMAKRGLKRSAKENCEAVGRKKLVRPADVPSQRFATNRATARCAMSESLESDIKKAVTRALENKNEGFLAEEIALRLQAVFLRAIQDEIDSRFGPPDELGICRLKKHPDAPSSRSAVRNRKRGSR